MKEWEHKAIETLFTLLVIFVFRLIFKKYIDKSTLQSEQLKRRWQVQVRNLSFLIFVFSIFMIWGTELRSIALSLMAVIAACVLATKELILCLTGSFLKASTGSFTIGDRVQINNYRGIVTDQTLLSTTILEVGPQMDSHQITGKTVVLPNSLFLNQAVINEEAGDWILHSFSVKIKIEENYNEIKEAMLKALKDSCVFDVKKVTKYLNKHIHGKNIDAGTCEPRVVCQLIDSDNVKLIFRAPIPIADVGRVEQKVTDAYIHSKVTSLKEKAAKEAAKENLEKED